MDRMKQLLVVLLLAAPIPLRGQDIVAMRDGASTALEQKDYAKCLTYAPLGRQKHDAETLYYVASCLALDGKTDAAFAALDDMLTFWWTDTALLRSDPNLAGLRQDACWEDVLARSDANWPAIFGESNRELAAISRADQADREAATIDWKAMAERDRQRRARVDEIIAAGGAKTSWDYCNAALVMQHGTESASYRKAHELAVCGVETGMGRGCKGLAAAALDRYLQSIGKPQIYGTQVRRVDGVWTLEPIDESAVTDEERRKWNLPPLAEFKRRVAEANKSH
jgi:hypothetical protein